MYAFVLRREETMSVAIKKQATPVSKPAHEIDEHIVEILSDSGEGAQKCGQSFGAISARLGYGIWTVEIIPAEIQPPARSVDGVCTQYILEDIRLRQIRINNMFHLAHVAIKQTYQYVVGQNNSASVNLSCSNIKCLLEPCKYVRAHITRTQETVVPEQTAHCEQGVKHC